MKTVSLKRRILQASVVFAVAISVAAGYLIYASRFDRSDLAFPDNLQFVDRSGVLLRFTPDARGERHLWVSGNAIPRVVKEAFIAAEDQRFYLHTGFDVPAIIRAAKDNWSAGRIVSGASTITQQTVRLVYPGESSYQNKKRSYRRKAVEILRAARMELSLTKNEILEQYLNRVPMGNNIVGVELAARTYLGKTVAQLSAAEAALLAAIPKAPGLLNPYAGNIARLMARKKWVLSQMTQAGFISQAEEKTAESRDIAFRPFNFPSEAPHIVDTLIKRTGSRSGTVVTTVDIDVQRTIEQILASHAMTLKYDGARQAAAMIVRNSSMEVIASVGSLAYSPENKGYNNGTTALRSAGSTLKPFLYAQALDDGFNATRAIEDTLRKYKTPTGDYVPANFDKKYYGPVTMRSALGNSLNISAIKMLEAVGQRRYFSLLSDLGFINDASKTSDYFGLGLVIGNPEVTLEELVRGYAMLSNGGELRDLAYEANNGRVRGSVDGHTIFSPEASYIITDILSDPSARFMTFDRATGMRYPFKVSLKTGTSTKYRDAWAIGYTPEYTVGAWAGNFEGDPTFNMSGAKGAAPILYDIFKHLYKGRTPSLVEPPEGVVSAKVCGISGMKPGKFCRNVSAELFIKGNLPQEVCSFHKDDEKLHKLPAAYAQWVYDKKRAGTAGSYRIGGLADEFDGEDSVELPEERNYRVDKTGHYTIGVVRKPQNSGGVGYGVAITYPLHNDTFIIDKRGSGQVIKLEATTEKPVKYMQWYIDGKLFKKVTPAYHAYWKPSRGWHTISVVSPDNIGDSIKIRIE